MKMVLMAVLLVVLPLRALAAKQPAAKKPAMKKPAAKQPAKKKVTHDIITIDGKLDDWTSSATTFEMPKAVQDATDSPYGKVKKLWVTHDDKFLYFRVDFVNPRPFTDATQSAFKKGYWTNQRFIILDVDGDSRLDYRSAQIKLKKSDMNNTYVAKWTGKKWVTKLWHQGKKSKWSTPAIGTLGHYSKDASSIEIRMPREPLEIQLSELGVQVFMSYRDKVKGSNKWISEYYPSRQKWFVYNLKTGTTKTKATKTKTTKTKTAKVKTTKTDTAKTKTTKTDTTKTSTNN